MAVHRLNTYIACEEMDFYWSESEVIKFEQLWNRGECIFEIAKHLKRDPDEVALLVIDRSRARAIEPRKGGIWGKEYLELKRLSKQRRSQK